MHDASDGPKRAAEGTRAPSRPAEMLARSVEDLLLALSLEEKAALLTGDSAWTTTALPRLGIRALRMADGPHGVRRTHASGSMAYEAHPATCFPTASCTAATWDPALVFEMGQAIAREAIALEVDVVLGPGVNIKRSPLCGRNFEYFSEDPFLAGEFAVAWIRGIQSLGVGASLKHFAVNNQETRRMTVSAELDERTLREVYLPAFETAVKRAQPWTVMCAYNRINGTYASEHAELLTNILRTEWGFEGFVVSDWGAVHDRPGAVAAGLDLEMPGPRPRRVHAVVDAVRAGRLDEAAVDEAARRILKSVARATETPKGQAFDATSHHALARRAAADGMVLLKNDGLLPLAPENRIAVIGRAAREPRIQGGGSSQITPTRLDVPLDELRSRVVDGDVEFAEGYDYGEGPRAALIADATATAARSDVAIIFLAMPEAKEREGADRLDLGFSDQQVELVRAVTAVQPRTVVVLFNGSAVDVAPWVDGAAAVLEAWYAGQAVGSAVADVLFGAVNPSGRLAETFAIRVEDTPAYLSFPGDGDVVLYGEGIFVGYRWYEARRQHVTFPFGHGLSYTTFAYGDGRVPAERFTAAAGTTVCVDVTNTGSRAGSEVVQLYVRPIAAPVRRPEKELRGFAKVHLAPGESRTVMVQLDRRAFSYWDSSSHSWVAPPGMYELLIGSSSADIRATIPVALIEEAAAPSSLTDMSPLQDWLGDPAGRRVALELLREIGPILGRSFGGDGDGPDGLASHADGYFGTMPLRGLLEFAAPGGGPEPETRLDRMLESVSSQV